MVSTPGAVFALWGTPAPDDMDSVVESVRTGATNFGAPVVYVARIPAGAPAPESEARARLNQVLPDFLHAISSYHVVLEGDGFGAAMKRSVLTGIFQLGRRRNTFFVHASFADLLRSLKGSELTTVQALLQTAETSGLLDRRLH